MARRSEDESPGFVAWGAVLPADGAIDESREEMTLELVLNPGREIAAVELQYPVEVYRFMIAE